MLGYERAKAALTVRSPGFTIMSWTCTVVSSDDATEMTPGGLDGDDTANLRANSVFSISGHDNAWVGRGMPSVKSCKSTTAIGESTKIQGHSPSGHQY